MIDFPASPTNGQVFTSGGSSWTYDGTKWVAAGNAIMPPLATGDNRIINGDMRIDQRNNGAAGGAVGAYTVDRWNYLATQTGKIQWQRTSITNLPGYAYCLQFASLSAYAVTASDTFVIVQPIEADAVTDFAWGGASAQPVTLSFWVFSSLTGTFSGSVRNYANTRSYPFTYSLPSANTWTKIVVTIPGDTAGTWVFSGNGGGITVGFDLGTGATYRGPAGVWAGTQYNGVTGSISIVSTNAALFCVTGVKLEIGSVATPFNRQSLAKSMADCQRYYCVMYALSMLGYTPTVGSGFGYSTGFPTSMRAAPTINLFNQSYSNMTGLTSANTTADAVFLYANSTVIGTGQWTTAFTASAEL
jgi:hypothetical protein